MGARPYGIRDLIGTRIEDEVPLASRRWSLGDTTSLHMFDRAAHRPKHVAIAKSERSNIVQSAGYLLRNAAVHGQTNDFSIGRRRTNARLCGPVHITVVKGDDFS